MSSLLWILQRYILLTCLHSAKQRETISMWHFDLLHLTGFLSTNPRRSWTLRASFYLDAVRTLVSGSAVCSFKEGCWTQWCVRTETQSMLSLPNCALWQGRQFLETLRGRYTSLSFSSQRKSLLPFTCQEGVSFSHSHRASSMLTKPCLFI